MVIRAGRRLPYTSTRSLRFCLRRGLALGVDGGCTVGTHAYRSGDVPFPSGKPKLVSDKIERAEEVECREGEVLGYRLLDALCPWWPAHWQVSGVRLGWMGVYGLGEFCSQHAECGDPAWLD